MARLRLLQMRLSMTRFLTVYVRRIFLNVLPQQDSQFVEARMNAKEVL